jgi:ferric-dicitrate binding protein FerR (iron transport regulator)
MSEWDQNIFEELISDNQFLAWAKGDDLSIEEHWSFWEKNHPEHSAEFREAVRTVKSLRFRGLGVSNSDIAYSWTKTSEKIKQSEPVSRVRFFLSQATKVAAVLLLPFMVVSGWLLYNQHNLTQKYLNLLENKHEQNLTVVAPVCARIVVDLPDGTKVWLNSGSELTYPIVFNTTERRVHLTGEAYFKVNKSETPFFVSNLGPEIKVYGTEFNVNSYANEDLVTVALAEGKVSLNSEGKEQFIKPGQVSAFDKKSRSITIENADVVTYSSWREGKYIFRDTPLSSILRILQRQHNVNINLMNPELGNYRYNATIQNESLEQILQLLSLSAPIQYNFKRKELKSDGTYIPDNIDISADNTRIIKN